MGGGGGLGVCLGRVGGWVDRQLPKIQLLICLALAKTSRS